jgi:hypothetical protein
MMKGIQGNETALKAAVQELMAAPAAAPATPPAAEPAKPAEPAPAK